MTPEKLVSVVEDDDSLRDALVGLLRSLGYAARGFGSAEAFLSVGDGRCACIITDVRMPGMSGIEMTRRLRKLGYAAPVIMITARTEPAVDLQAAECGVVCLLRKPFDVAALTDCLERALAA